MRYEDPEDFRVLTMSVADAVSHACVRMHRRLGLKDAHADETTTTLRPSTTGPRETTTATTSRGTPTTTVTTTSATDGAQADNNSYVALGPGRREPATATAAPQPTSTTADDHATIYKQPDITP